ncbi:MAG: hypothetical protein M3365_01110 [Gemmatimonadota bacterium]|nr:hypothetical protein [Gemmatimonadota bacterium]
MLAPDADAQTGRQRAPVIRVSTALGSSVVSNYIEPSISLGEDAYVFVIAVDVDRNVQVLHPLDPGISVRMTSRRQLYLPRFFAGFDQDSRFASRGGSGYSSFDGYGDGYTDTRGTLIALASRKPFNLSAISVGGDWDTDALRELVRNRGPHDAAGVLARYLGARGEQIGRDVHRFAGFRGFYNTAYQNSSYYQCAGYYGALGYARAYASGYSISYFRAAQLRQAGYVVSFLGIDACGQPRFAVYPFAVAGPPAGRPPATGAFPESRLPVTVPRNPARDEAAVGQIIGTRPQTQERSTDSEVTNRAPAGRVIERPRVVERVRAEPVVVERVRAEPVERFHPQPVERARPEPAGGTLSERPRPHVEAAPAPRAPERVSPPVYIPERVAAPPPPPPQPAPVQRERPAPTPEP